MGKAKQEYQAAAGEARRIAQLLADAHTEFDKYQKLLHDLVDEARRTKYQLSDKGVEDVDPRQDSPTASGTPGLAEERQAGLDSMVSRLKNILLQATAADEACAAGLNKDANGADNHGFNTKSYTTLDDVEVDQASALMKKDGRLTDAEFAQLRKLLAANKNDPEFSHDFAVRVGAEGTLEKYNQLLNPPPGTTLSKTELSELKTFQRDLGTTIGTATRSDDGHPDAGITKFQKDLLALGSKEFNANPTDSNSSSFNGYQVASSLMSNGKWDKGFLQEYGNALITAEKNGANVGQNPDAYWSGSGTRSLGSTNMGVLDPMAGFMDALGHNPEASTDFLTSSTTFDGEKVDHLDYLMKDRHWPEGAGYTGDAKNPTGYNNLGHAIESATTGHSYDAEIPNPLPKHSQEQADLTSQIIHSVSEDPKLAHDGMKDSLGRMSAEYMPDINYALANKEEKIDDLYPMGDSARAAIGENAERDATRFLYTVGQDPDGYAAINYGQTQYTSSLIDYHLQHPDAYDLSPGEKVQKISTTSAEVEGIIGSARQDAVIHERVASDAVFNERLASAGEWAKAGVGIGIGAGTATITSPLGGTVAGLVAESVTGQVIDSMVAGTERDRYGEAVYSAGGNIQQHKDSFMAVTGDAARLANSRADAGMNAEQIGTAVSGGLDRGHSNALSDLNDYARDLGANPAGK